MANIVVAPRRRRPRRVHLELIEAPSRYFAACAAHLMTDVPSRGLTHHPALVNCAACKTLILAVLREKANEVK